MSMRYLQWFMKWITIAYFLLFFFKLSFAHSQLFGDFRFFNVVLVELPILVIFFGILELLFRRGRVWLYFSVNVLLSLALFALIVYFQYFGAIATYTSLQDLGQTAEISDSIWLLIKPSFWLLFYDLPILLGIMIWNTFSRRGVQSLRIPVLNRVGISVLTVALLIALMNALNSIDASVVNEHKKAEGMGIFSYQAYVVYADMKRDYTPEQPLTLRAVQSVKGIIVPENPKYEGIAKDQDIYLIQLEAIQNFFIGLKVDGREVTPHLNSLVEESFYFPHVFQQIGKGNTSDAEFITNASVYTTGVSALSTQFANREVPGLPRHLSKLGYESITLHTNDVSFWDRHLMYKALGFDRYYDKNFFGEEDFLVFGASDEVLYKKSLELFVEMKNEGKKIYANLIAMSSHSPFEIPEEKKPLPLPQHLQDTLLGKYIQAAHYADTALGQFIEGLKEYGLWDNATLLINGDHFGFSVINDEEELQLAADLLGLKAYTRVEMFNIPLIIRVAGHHEPVVVETIGGQVDFMPTLANLLGLSLADQIYFGQDLLNQTSNLLPQQIYLPTGSFINDEVMFIPGAGFHDGWMIPIFDRDHYPELEPYRSDFQRALKLVELSSAYLHGLPLLE